MNTQKPVRGTQLNRTHSLAKGLVGCWIFNELTGETVFDLSGNSNNGTLENGVAWGSDGLEFDGVDDYVNLGDMAGKCISDPSVCGAITVEMWIYIKGGYYIISSGAQTNSRGFYLSYHNGSRVVGLRDGTNEWALTGVNMPLNEWHHYIFTWDGSNLTYYVDGAISATDSSPASKVVGDTNTILSIGCPNSGLGAFTSNSSISSVSIWNQAKSAEEIAWLYREPYAMFEPAFNPALLYSAAPPVGAIMNQFQKANIGADLYNGVLI